MQLLIILGIILSYSSATAEGTGLLNEAIAPRKARLPADISLATAPVDAEEDVVHARHVDHAVTGRRRTTGQVLRIGERVVVRRIVARVREDVVCWIEDG